MASLRELQGDFRAALLGGDDAAAAAAVVDDAIGAAASNEVGLGLVPTTPLGREYRDILGRVNAAWADAAERAYFVVAGRALPLERLDV